MTLLELSEPLFQYICRVNRSARKGGNYDLAQVLQRRSRVDEAIRFYTAARSIRPETAFELALLLEQKSRIKPGRGITRIQALRQLQLIG